MLVENFLKRFSATGLPRFPIYYKKGFYTKTCPVCAGGSVGCVYGLKSIQPQVNLQFKLKIIVRRKTSKPFSSRRCHRHRQDNVGTSLAVEITCSVPVREAL